MTKTERLYRNKKTFNYAKMKNDQFYIENNDDDDEIFESFESENEIFDQKNENQEFFQKENQEKSQIVLHQNNSISYSAYYSQTTDIKQRTTQN